MCAETFGAAGTVPCTRDLVKAVVPSDDAAELATGPIFYMQSTGSRGQIVDSNIKICRRHKAWIGTGCREFLLLINCGEATCQSRCSNIFL